MKRSELKAIINECIQELNEGSYSLWVGQTMSHRWVFGGDVEKEDVTSEQWKALEYYGYKSKQEALKALKKVGIDTSKIKFRDRLKGT